MSFTRNKGFFQFAAQRQQTTVAASMTHGVFAVKNGKRAAKPRATERSEEAARVVAAAFESCNPGTEFVVEAL